MEAQMKNILIVGKCEYEQEIIDAGYNIITDAQDTVPDSICVFTSSPISDTQYQMLEYATIPVYYFYRWPLFLIDPFDKSYEDLALKLKRRKESTYWQIFVKLLELEWDF